MGFADYFNRYPISAAAPKSESDKNFVNNTINAFTHTHSKMHTEFQPIRMREILASIITP